MTRERVHEIGAERHGLRWLLANQRAVENLWGTSLQADSAEVKDVLPIVLLRVLDGHMIDLGYHWEQPMKSWVLRPRNV